MKKTTATKPDPLKIILAQLNNLSEQFSNLSYHDEPVMGVWQEEFALGRAKGKHLAYKNAENMLEKIIKPYAKDDEHEGDED